MTTANFDEVRAHLERLQTTVDALADGVLPLASGPQAVAFHAIHHHFNFADDGLYCVAATVPGAGRIAAETSAVAQLVGKVCQIVSAELGTIINNCRRAIYHLYMQNLRFHHMHSTSNTTSWTVSNLAKRSWPHFTHTAQLHVLFLR